MDALKVTELGQAVTINIVPILEGVGLTKSSHFDNHLIICDVHSCFMVLHGLENKESESIIRALMIWIATYQSSDATFYPGALCAIRTNADTKLMSKKLLQDCIKHHIHLTHAAPRHQEMNGLVKRA